MKPSQIKLTRRILVTGGATTLALIPLSVLTCGEALAQPARLDPSDPTAKALGYVTSSPKPDERCANCTLFQGKAGDAEAACAVFAGKTVVASGWCKSWTKKT